MAGDIRRELGGSFWQSTAKLARTDVRTGEPSAGEALRFPRVESPPMPTTRKPAKASRVSKLGRHSSGQAKVTLGGQVAVKAPTSNQATLKLGDLRSMVWAKVVTR